MLELDPRLLCGEAPLYGAFGRVAVGLPRTYFPSQTLPVGDAAAALPPARRETVRIDEEEYCGKPIMSGH